MHRESEQTFVAHEYTYLFITIKKLLLALEAIVRVHALTLNDLLQSALSCSNILLSLHCTLLGHHRPLHLNLLSLNRGLIPR